jgi:ABC-type uncharacterized transport system fused permease/ATPase subunit
MQQSTVILVIYSLIAIIPALIVAVVLFLRQEAMRGDMITRAHRVDLVAQDYNNILSQFAAYTNRLAALDADVNGQKQRSVNLEESLQNLSQKWSSRERAEKMADRRREERDVTAAAEHDGEPFVDIPGTIQQTLQFVPQQQPPPPQSTRPVIRRHRQG